MPVVLDDIWREILDILRTEGPLLIVHVHDLLRREETYEDLNVFTLRSILNLMCSKGHVVLEKNAKYACVVDETVIPFKQVGEAHGSYMEE